jgi:hypothetical protein
MAKRGRDRKPVSISVERTAGRGQIITLPKR